MNGLPIDEDLLLVYSPLMCDPPMATMKEMKDGTYTLEDVVDMNILIKWRADQARAQQEQNK